MHRNYCTPYKQFCQKDAHIFAHLAEKKCEHYLPNINLSLSAKHQARQCNSLV